MSQDSIDRIENCRKSEEGDNLLIQHGEKTYAFEKPIQSVPSVSIEGVSIILLLLQNISVYIYY